MPYPKAPSPEQPRPFVVEHVREGLTRSGSFAPAARLVLTPALRLSGLLAALPDAEAKSLLLLLTFLTPNGDVRASLPELAEGLRVSEDKARRRMGRLADLRWRGRPLALSRATDTGLELFTLSPALVEERQAPEAAPLPPAAPYRAAGREAVISYTRETYARPRAEVEAGIARRMGWGSPDGEDLPPLEGEGAERTRARREAYRSLLKLGVPPEQATHLATAYPPDEVTDQINWLPWRGAKSPARFVVAAIAGRYEPPPQARPPDPGLSAGTAERREVSLDIPPAAGTGAEGEND